jgi:hypothetical protein
MAPISVSMRRFLAGVRGAFDLSGRRAPQTPVRSSVGSEPVADISRGPDNPRTVFDLKAPRQRRDLGLSDRQTTDIAWEEHVAEKFGNREVCGDGSQDSE